MSRHNTTKDAARFAVAAGALVCLLGLIGVSALVGAWFGASVGHTLLKGGLVVLGVITVTLLLWFDKGQR